ncbi:MAG TPA: 3-deoxy-7-phosphoheptulonate synthase [Bacteroidales bacterium]|nr:3-deoxy-7-phosphoheptulonate synthase [Bacteroidales bacterium]
MECKDLEILPLRKWVHHDGLTIIAGPCSAESEEQLMETAKALLASGKVQIYRAGVWKPRTRPSGFEGKGKEALEWLLNVKNQTGLLTAVEVGNPQHVELALKYQVDVLWIGARTTVNPFMVSEIAQAIKGTGIAVMIKNPVNPDLDLWMGAIERIHQAGIRRLAAIHRGFYFFRKTPWRNAPMWEIPIELKRICPRLPIIVDPSHICGKTSLIPDISQKALDLEMDGLMIEVHIHPNEALTDKEQQLTPQQFEDLINQLVIRVTSPKSNDETLERLRLEVDKLDQEMLEILSRRMAMIDEIGHYKNQHHITILQIKRWRQMLADRLESGSQLGLDKDFLQQLLQLVHDESIRRQQNILNPHHDNTKED